VPARRSGRRRGPGRTLLIAALVVVGVLVVGLVAFGVDSARASDEVPRNVAIDGTAVGGMSGPDLWRATHQVADQWAAVPVTVTTPKGEQTTTLGALGVRVDERALAQQAWDARAGGFLLARPVAWITSFFDQQSIAPSFTVDPSSAAAALAPLEAQVNVPPTEPNLSSTGASIALVAGIPGQTIDPAAVADAAATAARQGQRAITVAAPVVPLPPKTTDAQVQTLVDQANQLTDKRLSIYLGNKSGVVDAKILRSWLTASLGPDGLVLSVDPAKVSEDVTRILGTVGTPVVETGFTVGPDGKVAVVPGSAGQRCCTPESVSGIVTALQQGKGRVDLQLESVQPAHDKAWADKLGVTTQIATFTTPYPAGQPRVTNIHRFADLMKGKVIEPGATLSLNEAVGQRTEAKGFVKAPVIYDSKYDEDVGGGVSQFAATMFNAAFFGGLDIPAYQMHSIYIDRYPYGREATISWTSPDLKIRNNTPYGVLVWPTYTDTSVTVTLYSTPFMKGDQTNQTKEPKGPCTKVTTERTRTAVSDGKTSTDTFVGLYQPSEGVKCD